MIDAPLSVPGAYAWWYLDALSDDRRDGVVCIFFHGSVFSPYYADRLARGEAARPEEHVAVNCAFYRDGRRTHWLMAERASGFAIDGGRSGLTLGESTWRWHGRTLEIHVDDAGPSRTRGRIRFESATDPSDVAPVQLAPDRPGHLWTPRAPRGRVSVAFERPGLRFDGWGYHDENRGPEPLAAAFREWEWARVSGPESTRIVYDVRTRGGQRHVHSVEGGRRGSRSSVDTRAPTASHRSLWRLRLPDAIPSPDAPVSLARVGRNIEDTPFYARYLLLDPGNGAEVGVGESLDLDRFANPVVRWMVSWKMWRRLRGGWLRAGPRRAPAVLYWRTRDATPAGRLPGPTADRA